VATWSQFSGFAKVLKRYLRDYGGMSAVVSSPLFVVSLFIAGIDYDTWLHAKWVELSQSLIPSLLGFSLGTYAILFSLMTGRLKKALQTMQVSPGVSYLAMVNATFFHFIFVQILALVWAFLYAGTAMADVAGALGPFLPWVAPAFAVMSALGSFIGFQLLVYSFMLILGSALAVYRLASIREPMSDDETK